MKKILLAIITLSFIIRPGIAQQTTDDTDILDMLPPIIAAASSGGSKTNPLITKVRQIGGTWRFDMRGTNNNLLRDYIRLNNGTARIDDQIAIIDGKGSFLADFFSPKPARGAYDGAERIYLVIFVWGPPENDLASYYFFTSPTRNNAATDCHFYGDTRGNISDFATCDAFTKAKISNVQESIPQASQEKSNTANQLRQQRYEHYNQQKPNKSATIRTEQQQIYNLYRDMAKAAFAK